MMMMGRHSAVWLVANWLLVHTQLLTE